MSEPDKRQIGDGSDNTAEAAKQVANAAKQMGKQTAHQAVGAGVKATANAAAATVQASVESGKAVAEMAAGTAAGGPWGAILSAAWALRHTLYKILIFICMILLIFIILIVSLPSIILNSVFGLDGTTIDMENPTTMTESYNELANEISIVVEEGYDLALDKAEDIMKDSQYDYELSMESLINYAHSSAGYDVCYILAAYSASLQQQGASKEDMLSKLRTVEEDMFPVTYQEMETEVSTDSEEETEIIEYVECTIHPFDNTVIIDAFGIDSSAIYGQFPITYSEVIQKMADSLKMTLYGSLGSGQAVPLTDLELLTFVNRQHCTPTRKHILTTALSLVGKVPYFWGGKSAPGWNDEWNTPKLVTAEGSSSTGTIRPYGLDCSGFTDWVYKTALNVSLYAGSWNQWDNTYAITEEELLPGDLGFMAAPGTVPVNHVMIYAGTGENGEQMWVHCTSGSGVVLNSPDYVTQFRRPMNVNYDNAVPSLLSLET